MTAGLEVIICLFVNGICIIICDLILLKKNNQIISHFNYNRMNQLKHSGEEEWKKRVQRNLELEPGSASLMEVKLREKVGNGNTRPSSIADRLTLLNTAQMGWKERVEETDAKRFTVAHKLAGQYSRAYLHQTKI